MFESREIANTDPGIVDPRMAAEAVSMTFLQSTLKRDLYRDRTSGTIIETRYCHVYAYREDAILQWEGRYGHQEGRTLKQIADHFGTTVSDVRKWLATGNAPVAKSRRR